VTHRYTLLVGGIVLPGRDAPDASAIAWAEDTVLALGSDEQIRAISRGDSHLVDLGGAWVVPLGDATEASWPPDATLEIGGRADLAILDGDPRDPVVRGTGRPRTLAAVRGGRVVAGGVPGVDAHPGGGGGHDAHDPHDPHAGHGPGTRPGP
jgi:cytosine/adenosine deaminase-related metal-dependent hydrolase